MKRLIKHKVFISAFLATYFLFFIVTVFILDLKKPGIGVGSTDYGFPFTYYSAHCFGGDYLWIGLISNVLTAAIISLVFGLVGANFWLKFFSPKFRARWNI